MRARKRLGLGLACRLLLDDFIDACKEVIGNALNVLVVAWIATAGLGMSDVRAAVLILLGAWLAVLIARGIRRQLAQPWSIAPSTSQSKRAIRTKTVLRHLLSELRSAEECTLSQAQLVERLCHGHGYGVAELKDALDLFDDLGWIEQRRVVLIVGADSKCEVRLTACGRAAWAKMRAPEIAWPRAGRSNAMPTGAALAKRALKRRPPRRAPRHRRGAPAARSGDHPWTA